MNLLTNSSFDIYGTPSFVGWHVNDFQYVHLSNDVPPGAQEYSLVLDNSIDTEVVLDSLPLMYQIVPMPPGRHVYRLSFLEKTDPPDLIESESVFPVLFIGDSLTYWAGAAIASDTASWGDLYVVNSDTINVVAPKSFKLCFYHPKGDILGAKTHFSNIKLEVLN